MLKGVIFDLDGTLLNTLYDLKEAVNYALRKNNLKEITLEQTRKYVGNGIKVLIERAIGEVTDTKIKEDSLNFFKEYYDKHQRDYTVPYDGVLEMIESVKSLGFKMAIVSNKYQEGVDNLCIPLFGKSINVLVGSRDNVKLKPNPDMVLLACNELKLKPEECIFVGDSETDAITGKNANMKVIGVTWGFRDVEILKELKVDYIINQPNEIINILLKEKKENG